MTKRLPLFLLLLLILLYAGFFSWLTIQRYHAFEARALDLGNLNQAIWNTAHGDWFRLTNQEEATTTRLALHVEPILLVIAPFYRLFPQVEFLLILQTVIVALGAIPLFALAGHRKLSAWIGLLLAAAYLLNPSIQAANWLEFHPVTLAPTFLMAAFYFMVTRRTGWFALFAVLSASCKEEIGLLVFMMGLYAWLALRRPKFGAVTMVLALAWSLFAVLGIQAYFAGGNIHWGRYEYLGATTAEKVTSLLTRPGVIWTQLSSAGVLRYWFELLLPVGFIAILAPEILVLALPSVAINLLADFAPMHEVTTLIYAAPIVAFVMLATVIGVAHAGALWVRLGNNGDAGRAALNPSPANWAAAVLVVTGALISQRLYGYLPGSGHFLALTVNDHHRAAQTIIDQIPADAGVSAQDRLDPHVSGRRTVYLFPRIEDADTIFLDVTGSAWPLHPSDLKAQVDTLLAGDYGVAAAKDGYLLLSKQAASDAIPPEFFTAWTAPSPATDVQATLPLSITFGDELRLLEATVGADRYGELVTEFTWEAVRPIDRELRFYVGYLDKEGNVLHDSLFYPPVTALWYPTRMWSPGQPVTVRMLPWTLPDDAFALVAGVYEDENGWTDGKRLPVTSPAVRLPILESDTVVRLGGFEKAQGAGSWAEVTPDRGAPAPTLDILFGDSIRLTAVESPGKAKPGSTIPVRLAWQTDKPPALDYSRFVHLLDATGAKVAQFDSAPGDAIGKLPFSNWPPGWRGLDTVSLEVPADLAPGEYTIMTGLYDWQSGARLPVTVAGAAAGDTYVVGEVHVAP